MKFAHPQLLYYCTINFSCYTLLFWAVDSEILFESHVLYSIEIQSQFNSEKFYRYQPHRKDQSHTMKIFRKHFWNTRQRTTKLRTLISLICRNVITLIDVLAVNRASTYLPWKCSQFSRSLRTNFSNFAVLFMILEDKHCDTTQMSNFLLFCC